MNYNRKIFRIATILALFALGNPAGFTQQQSQPSKKDVQPLTYQLEVGLVQIPIRVTDKKGQWVGGLKKSDITLYEDGERQEIQYMDEMDAEAQTEPETAQEPAAKGNTIQIPEKKINRIRSNCVILIIDGANTGKTALSTHRRYLQDFLTGYAVPNTLFSLIFIRPTGDYQMIQNFTSNKKAILDVLPNLSGSSAGYENRIFTTSQIAETSAIEDCSAQRSADAQFSCADGALRTVIRKANNFAEEEHTRSKNTINSLKDIFAKAQHVPGQKSVLLISEGLDPAGSFYYNYAANVIDHFVDHYGLSPSMKSLLTDVKLESSRYVSDSNLFRELMRSATSADLSIFWVNPQYGKTIDEISAEVGSMRTIDNKLINAPDVTAMMRDVAEETGGEATSSTDMKGFYNRLSQEIRRYYLISYKPPRALNDGKFHKIEVKANNQDVKIVYKKQMKDTSIEDRINEELAAAHDFPDVSTSFSLLDDVMYFKKSGETYHVMTKIGVPYREMEPQIGDQAVRNEIHLSYLIRNDQGDVLAEKHPILRVSSKYNEFEQMQKNGSVLEYQQNFELPAGLYHLSLVAMDVAGWKTAEDSILLKLPGKVESCLSLSPPMLAGQIRKSEATQKSPTPTQKGEIMFGDYTFLFPVHRVFPQKGSLNGFYQIYNAKFPSTIRFRLYRDKTVFVNETPAKEINTYTDVSEKLVTNFFSVPYNNLAPGSYELEIQVKNAGCTASTRADFDVVAQGS
jgi:VWFA-related protein